MNQEHFMLTSVADDGQTVYFDLNGFAPNRAGAYRYPRFVAAVTQARILSDVSGREVQVCNADGVIVMVAPVVLVDVCRSLNEAQQAKRSFH